MTAATSTTPPLALRRVYSATCTACSLHEAAKTVCIPGIGSTFYRSMVVGEAPGANEDDRGEPFIGRAGETLNRALQEAFLTENARKEIFITNTVKCRPPGNRNPSGREIGTCVDLYLSKEISLINPIAILALGNPAVEALLGFSGISQMRGKWYVLDRTPETLVMPTWHPAYVNYNGGVGGDVWQEFLGDIETFATKIIASFEVPL